MLTSTSTLLTRRDPRGSRLPGTLRTQGPRLARQESDCRGGREGVSADDVLSRAEDVEKALEDERERPKRMDEEDEMKKMSLLDDGEK